MSFHVPGKIAGIAVEVGVQKTRLSLPTMLMLGFLGGAFISLGFLLDIRVIGNLPQQWGSLSNLLGGIVFPLGLILVILAGGELITGNMLSVSIALYARKITLKQLLNNWFWVTFANFAGALFVAYFFGHVVGLTESGPYLAKTVAIAQAKLQDTFGQTLISAIGCNWLVCLAIWIAFGADDIIGKFRDVVSDYGFCRHWIPARCSKYVCNSCSYICGAFFMNRFYW